MKRLLLIVVDDVEILQVRGCCRFGMGVPLSSGGWPLKKRRLEGF